MTTFNSQCDAYLYLQIAFHSLNVISTVRALLGPAGEHALQCVLERLPEVTIEVRVDQRVQHRVKVADPEQNDDYDVWTGARLSA